MIKDFIDSFENSIYKKVENFTTKKHWILFLTCSLPIVVLFFSFPSYDRLHLEFSHLWQAILDQIDNPFEQRYYDPFSHEAKIKFRLTVPLIAKFLNLNIIGVLVFQAIIGLLLFFFSIKFFVRITQDNISAFLLSLTLSMIWAGKTSFIDIRGMFDGIAIFFLIVAMYYKFPVVIYISVLLASWTDERGLVASSLVFLFWVYTKDFKFKHFINQQSVSVVFAWISYFVIRVLLIKNYGFTTETEGTGLSILREQINNLPIGLWSALEGMWVLIIFSIIIQYKQKKWLYTSLYFLSICIILIVGISVTDITRSMAYLFPASFIALIILKEVESTLMLRKISLSAAFFSFLYPTYDTTGDYFINWIYPLPLQILRMLYGTGEIFGNG